MRRKAMILILLSIISASVAGCSSASMSNNKPGQETSMEASTSSDVTTNTSESTIGSKDLDPETEKFFYGTWEIEKLLGFADSYNDASEYPTGQKVIGDQITVNKDIFSSKGFEAYSAYQFKMENPVYQIREIHYNADSFYRVDKIDLPSLNMNDQIKVLSVSDPSTGLAIPISFLDVNNTRLLLVLEATVFELKRVAE